MTKRSMNTAPKPNATRPTEELTGPPGWTVDAPARNARGPGTKAIQSKSRAMNVMPSAASTCWANARTGGRKSDAPKNRMQRPMSNSDMASSRTGLTACIRLRTPATAHARPPMASIVPSAMRNPGDAWVVLTRTSICASARDWSFMGASRYDERDDVRRGRADVWVDGVAGGGIHVRIGEEAVTVADDEGGGSLSERCPEVGEGGVGDHDGQITVRGLE